MGLPELVARLERDAEARVAAIDAGARAEVDALQAEARRLAVSTREDDLATRRATRRAKLARELAEAARRARIDRLRAQHALVDRVLARACELFEGCEHDAEYLAALPRRVAEALACVDPPAVIRCRPALAGIVRSLLADRHDVVCEEVTGMPVGITVRARDGSVEIDDTLPARLERARARLAIRIVGEVSR